MFSLSSLDKFAFALLAVVVGCTVVQAAPVDSGDVDRLSADKRAPNVDEFMSAMNGAQRLRYGKRASFSDVYESSPFAAPLPFVGNPYASYYPVDRMPMAKRMEFPQLVNSLNGAERLRYYVFGFGRK